MSKEAAEHHRKAAEHHEHAARHHKEAAKHHDAGAHEKAAHHAHIAHGHTLHATHHAGEAAKVHVQPKGHVTLDLKDPQLEEKVSVIAADWGQEKGTCYLAKNCQGGGTSSTWAKCWAGQPG